MIYLELQNGEKQKIFLTLLKEIDFYMIFI